MISTINKLAANLRGSGYVPSQQAKEQAQRERKIAREQQRQAGKQPSEQGDHCGCGPAKPVARFTDVCSSSHHNPVAVSGAKLVDDGSFENGNIRVPSHDQYSGMADRLGANFVVADNNQLILPGSADPTTGIYSLAYNPVNEGQPGLYRLTLTAPSQQDAKAFRSRVDLFWKQAQTLNGSQTTTSSEWINGREGIYTFEIQASASDTLIDIFALPLVSLGGNRGSVIEPALLAGFVIGGNYINLTGTDDTKPAIVASGVQLGATAYEDADVEIVSSSDYGMSPTSSGVSLSGDLSGYTLNIRAYGPQSSSFSNFTRQLLSNAGGN